MHLSSACSEPLALTLFRSRLGVSELHNKKNMSLSFECEMHTGLDEKIFRVHSLVRFAKSLTTEWDKRLTLHTRSRIKVQLEFDFL